MQTFTVRTSRRCEMVDITRQVQDVVSRAEATHGAVTVFVPHTTAGCTINENADPDVQHDMLMTLEQLIPKDRPGYRHGEGNSDSHLKASLMGSSVTVIVDNGELVLGTWQGVYFAEFDGPRQRKVHVQVYSL